MFREPRQTALFTERMKILRPAGEDFMRIRLMPDIPHDGIFRAFKHAMERKRQFDDSEITRQMPAILPDNSYYLLPNLFRKGAEL